jgi:hypothetical protein
VRELCRNHPVSMLAPRAFRWNTRAASHRKRPNLNAFSFDRVFGQYRMTKPG